MKQSFHIKIYVILLTIFYLNISGIYRHDIPKAEYIKLANQKQFDCVGKIFKHSKFVGSCVLINEHFVLSVGHNFVENDYKWDSAWLGNQQVLANLPYNHRLDDIKLFQFVFGSDTLRGKKIEVPNEFKNALERGNCDIAVIELDGKISERSNFLLPKIRNELNSIITIVGYGSTGSASDPKTIERINEKLAGQNIIDSIGGFKLNNEPTLLFCDMDSPTNEACNKMGSPKPLLLEYFISGGDSGGPVFRQINDSWQLVGLCKASSIDASQFTKTGYYGQVMKFTRVAPFTEWISKIINSK